MVENIVAASITLSAGGIIDAHLPDIHSLWTTNATIAAINGIHVVGSGTLWPVNLRSKLMSLSLFDLD